MNKKLVVNILAWGAISAGGMALPLSYVFAIPVSYSIDIATTTLEEPDRIVSLSGTAGANPYTGSLEAVHAAITDWGDGSSTIPLENFSIVSSTNSPKTFSATWSASHTYSAPGEYSITAMVYHGEVSEANEQYAIATTSVTVNPRIVAKVNGSGTIDPIGTSTVLYHGSKTYTINPGNGELLNMLTVDGIPVATGNSYTFTDVTTDHVIEAWFVTGSRNTLTATTTGEGTGTITSDPPGIACGSGGMSCDSHFSDGSTIVLTAAPDAPTSSFEGWGGACASAGTSSTCTVTLSEDMEVSAGFGISRYPLSVSASGGTGDGVISDAAENIYCDSANAESSVCTYLFPIGTPEILTAIPADGSSFVTWSTGPCAGETSTSCSFVINPSTTASTVTGVFNTNPVPGDSSLSVTIAGNGSVSSDPPGIDACDSGTCADNFVTGSTVTLTATPSGTSLFAGWSGDVCDGVTSTLCSFAIATTTSVTATFTPPPSEPVADIAVEKDADVATAAAGGMVHYHIVVTNLGPDAAGDVIATDTLPAGVSFIGVTTSVGAYQSSTGAWTIGDLAASATAYLDMEVMVDPASEPSTTIVNTVSASSDGAISIDPDLLNNVATASVAVAGGPMGAPDFAIQKKVDRTDPASGDAVHYAIEVTNNGDAEGTFMVAKDTWDSGLVYDSATSSQGTLALANGGMEWDIGTLAAHATATLDVVMTVENGEEGKTLRNGITVSSTLGSFVDPTPSDNTAAATVAVRAADNGNSGGGGSGGGGPIVTVAAGGGGPISYSTGGGGASGGGGAVLGTSTTESSLPGQGTSTVIVPPPEEGQVLGASTTCGYYLTSYIVPMSQKNAVNDPNEVKKLQIFLNNELGLDIPITGYYGPISEAAVKQFQVQHSTEILAPWVAYGLSNLNAGTGYVYKTTQRLINMIMCPSLQIPMPSLP